MLSCLVDLLFLSLQSNGSQFTSLLSLPPQLTLSSLPPGASSDSTRATQRKSLLQAQPFPLQDQLKVSPLSSPVTSC